ncbi:uncharacterized protein FFNC_02626 [Fusarium fujikuroi]
MSYKE